MIEYPYFLPCFVATCISTFCWLLGFFFLKETLQIKNIVNNDQEEEPLLSNTSTTQQQQNYNSIISTEEPETTRPHLTLAEKLTPPVLAISILYAVTAFQMLYFDGLFYICQFINCMNN